MEPVTKTAAHHFQCVYRLISTHGPSHQTPDNWIVNVWNLWLNGDQILNTQSIIFHYNRMHSRWPWPYYSTAHSAHIVYNAFCVEEWSDFIFIMCQEPSQCHFTFFFCWLTMASKALFAMRHQGQKTNNDVSVIAILFIHLWKWVVHNAYHREMELRITSSSMTNYDTRRCHSYSGWIRNIFIEFSIQKDYACCHLEAQITTKWSNL